LTLSIRPSPVTLSSSLNSDDRLTFFGAAAAAPGAGAGDAAGVVGVAGAAGLAGAAGGDATIRLVAMNVCLSRTATVADLPHPL